MTEKTKGFTKSGDSPPTPRKLSWQYHDLAYKIRLAPRHFAATNLLRFLGKVANDGGTSHYGYASLMANCDVRSRSAMATTVKYLLTVGIAEVGQPILTRTKGGIGNETSHYKLHLGAMQALVKHQGIFDPETGKLIRHARWERPDGVPVSDTPNQEGVPVNGGRGVPVNGDTGVPVSEQGCTCEPYSNPQGTPSLTPKKNPLSKAGAAKSFSSVSSNGEPEPTDVNPAGNGLVLTNSKGGSKSSRFTLKRWCGECNGESKITDGDVCPHCGEDMGGGGDWLEAPRSDAEGKHAMESILDLIDLVDHGGVFKAASPLKRRWIAMGKHAPEFQKWLDETGDTK
jgi:hypothetical protein